LISPSVERIVRVLPAIDFDDQSLVATDEVDYVRFNCFLPHEFKAAEPAVAER
jgi:hypothetical protein